MCRDEPKSGTWRVCSVILSVGHIVPTTVATISRATVSERPQQTDGATHVFRGCALTRENDSSNMDTIFNCSLDVYDVVHV